MKKFRNRVWICAVALLLALGNTAHAQAGSAAADLKAAAAAAPTATQMSQGDPGGTLTGTINDVPVSNAKAGVTTGDVANQVGQNKIAINFVWTLVTGFLVMFMQAGFAMVEAGLCRVKNANHTYMMNFTVYACGLFAYWLIGFAIQMGGAAGNGNLGGLATLAPEHMITLFGAHWGVWGTQGMFLSGHTYDVGVMVIFLFEMVFMDTALTIVTGAAAERWKFLTFCVSSVLMGAFTYPLFGNWAWGGGWLSALGSNLGLGHGYCDFAGSGVVHAVGGLTALAVALILGPRIGKFNRDGSSNAIIGHDISAVLVGCFILAFGWFGFNPGSTLGASAAGNLRIGTIAVDTMLAGCTGTFGALLYMWIFKGKPDAGMGANGLLAGLVAITAPSGFVNTVSAAIIGFIAGVLVCISVAFIENKLKVDDPVGAVSVHGTCGLWGVLSVGLFADGKSNYGGAWNGVNGSVTGLFYGDAGQLVAQLVGIVTLIGFVFTFSFVLNWILDITVGQRVSAESEVAGLDLPEMGQLGYPEFVFKPEPAFLTMAEEAAIA
ncbi:MULTISPECIES: ammonium transporter [Acidobacterium]|uniref:Ammonium transporter n=1 Tax=Acidobacterium capsulatum (strain ATCC 51196 / DSM 11244 / BCRC 80197 / JCM 7670 / NBRC 15755 / NCIMB 13165 / 161) TaxID=240015 RepID=C1F584_ACIC5|nr:MULTISPECIES: ammonium transporter [Acidobacterium]ACO32673.1 ammonium transporter [Acidobacterium capsulatum ATCC 51196]HCT59547.1 ammonium transporter [Acidobacterium sp.]